MRLLFYRSLAGRLMMQVHQKPTAAGKRWLVCGHSGIRPSKSPHKKRPPGTAGGPSNPMGGEAIKRLLIYR